MKKLKVITAWTLLAGLYIFIFSIIVSWALSVSIKSVVLGVIAGLVSMAVTWGIILIFVWAGETVSERE